MINHIWTGIQQELFNWIPQKRMLGEYVWLFPEFARL